MSSFVTNPTALSANKGPITAWSFSRWKDYDKCPFYCKMKHVNKMKEPSSPAMERGADIAQKSEDYFAGRISRIPAELSSLADDFRALKKQKTKFFEQMWGFKIDWTPTPWNDWNNCWLRAKIDVGYHDGDIVHIRDGKSGKFREQQSQDYMLQLSLYAATAAAQFPVAKSFTTQLLYTDLGIRYPNQPVVYTRKEAELLQKDWTKRTKKMLNDKTFKPTPGDACRWCAFAKSKGGPCKY